jgi:hypothetical protein
MKFVTLIKQLSLSDLKAMASGVSPISISDMDFLETLAAHKCIIVTPWVMRANPSGVLARVAKLSYDGAGNIDKPRVLVEVAKEFRRAKRKRFPFGGRFSQE